MIKKVIITSINEYGKKKTYRMEHVNKIQKIIENLGLRADYREIDEKFPKIMKREDNVLVFNLVPYYEGKYSMLVPATCDFLGIPYTGSGIFTLSTLRNGFFKDILEYHGLTVIPSMQEWSTQFSVLESNEELVFHGMDVDKDGEVLKGCTLEEKTRQYFESVLQLVKNSLKLHDYFEINISFRPVKAKGHAIVKVNPCPNFAVNSLYISTLRNKGLDYEDIICYAIGHSMKRQNFEIPFELENIKQKILKRKQEEAFIIY
ncbi:MAG: hypothetical protein ACFFCS_20245 [Candidatus Hodarchaeota archaeon]